MANFQLGDTEKVAYALTELDANSQPATANPKDTISIVSSNTSALTVVPDATASTDSVASGFLVAGTTVASNVSVTATVTHPDGSTLSVTDVFDVVGGTASSLSLGLGAPVSK